MFYTCLRPLSDSIERGSRLLYGHWIKDTMNDDKNT
jgi:hypothetical protein